MKRRWKILIGVAAFLVVAVVVVLLSLNSIARAGLQAGATSALGTKTSVDSVDISILGGEVAISGLAVDNPEGYPAGQLLQLDRGAVSLSIGSLLSDTVDVRSITLDGPVLSIVAKGLDTNLSTVLENAGSSEASAEEKPEEPAAAAKKFRIGVIKITGAKFRYQIAGAPAVTVPLPDIELKELTDANGKPLLLAGVFRQVLTSMARTALDKTTVQLPGELNKALKGTLAGSKALVKSTVEAGGKVLKGGAEAVKGVGGLLKGLTGAEQGAEEDDKGDGTKQ